MKTYIAEIKEVGNTTVLTPSITCDVMDKEDLIEFWGLADLFQSNMRVSLGTCASVNQ